MKRVTAALTLAALAVAVHAEIPFGSISQNEYRGTSNSGVWEPEKILIHNSEPLSGYEEYTEYTYHKPLEYGGSIDEIAIYDSIGNLQHSTYEYNYKGFRKIRRQNSDYNENGTLRTQSNYNENHFPRGTNYDRNHDINEYDGEKLIRKTTYINNDHYRTGNHKDTVVTTYSYNTKEQLISKVAKSVRSPYKESSSYSYSEQPTGEMLIVENLSIIDTLGNWKRPTIHPIKKYCTPTDTITENYLSETGKLESRTYSSYTLTGTLLEETVYTTMNGETHLQRSSKVLYNYEEPKELQYP